MKSVFSKSQKASDRPGILTHHPEPRKNVLDHYAAVNSFTSLGKRQDAEAEGITRQKFCRVLLLPIMAFLCQAFLELHLLE